MDAGNGGFILKQAAHNQLERQILIRPFIDNLSVLEYKNEIKTLETMLNHYLKTNKRLEMDE